LKFVRKYSSIWFKTFSLRQAHSLKNIQLQTARGRCANFAGRYFSRFEKIFFGAGLVFSNWYYKVP